MLTTLAIGNGGSDLSDFTASIDLPQASSFGKRPFNNIQSTIGEDLRQIAADSMKQAMEEEAKATLEDMGKTYDEWKKMSIQQGNYCHLPSALAWVGKKGRPVRSTILSPVMLSWLEREQKK